MHAVNRIFWKLCSEKYLRWFNGPNRILEVGSLDINGTVRDYFSGYSEYIGVDWREGPRVDVVSLAKDMSFEGQFDVVVSANMLEHDPTWKQSIEKMVQYVKPDGILLLAWGSKRCGAHREETAPDGKFHALAIARVVVELSRLDMYIHECLYEANLPNFAKVYQKQVKNAGFGSACLVAFKDKSIAPGERIFDELLDEDFS